MCSALSTGSGMRRIWFRRRTLALVLLVCLVLCMSIRLSTNNQPASILYQRWFENLRHLSANKTRIETRQIERDIQNGKRFPKILRTARQRVLDVNCAAVLMGDLKEIKRGRAIMDKDGFVRGGNISDISYIKLTKDCDKFKEDRDYRNYILSAEEEEFPVAYSILLYKEVEQAERLMRALYTPRNVFCLHVDMDAPPKVHQAVQGIADCFPNVFVVSRKEYMVYAGFTRLQADINCMQDLIQRNRDWKYFINLPSQQFPIKTNKEIVQILQTYNGANDIEGLTGNRRLEHRFTFRYVYKRAAKDQIKPKIYKTNYQRVDPPANVTMVKGSAYGVFSRAFVEWMLQSKTARELLDWMRDVYSPDEYYWATLQYNQNLGTPGSHYSGKPDNKPWLAVHAAWGGVDQCKGKYVRGVCVFGLGDLAALAQKRHLFVNKFYLEYQPRALECLEEWLHNRTAEPAHQPLNLTYYRQLPFINTGRVS
ncbi:beta-1,3-galactosyl-O-glycosyl-glycoprotein beta-1,6-N-acetylglucosaminyltransferase-like [Mya arenaria]|uniref:beta-1,3-galactosyl-O-glycosyl-glycoprotein beta-1,6-N-acetylglucosaminyltransferase-like n=1 Tax=Mya arenaria TaxID=6604 RepID=UPI0022E7D9B6|nr:beta-1,3-galactosyl-O-glycosyl-glycoprotein beta-1,6-N-acetylglucosaminyltransferase-like [Mya arenaria]